MLFVVLTLMLLHELQLHAISCQFGSVSSFHLSLQLSACCCRQVSPHSLTSSCLLLANLRALGGRGKAGHGLKTHEHTVVPHRARKGEGQGDTGPLWDTHQQPLSPNAIRCACYTEQPLVVMTVQAHVL